MKSSLSFTLSLLLITVFIEDIYCQNNEDEVNNFNLYNSQSFEFKSAIIEDSFKIYISVPDNYRLNDKTYPVIYVLDGDIAFGMITSIARYLEIGGNIPPAIIVGIGYGSLDKASANKRKRDYRPAQSGSAENFLKFFQEELIPYINSNYRTIPGDRTIYGYSMGGLFTIYALFTNPETFNRYIVGSPILVQNNNSIFNYEEDIPDNFGDKEIKLFISVGSEEPDEKYFNPIDSLVSSIQQRNYGGLKLDTKVFEGSNHLTGPAEAITYGLLSVFKKD